MRAAAFVGGYESVKELTYAEAAELATERRLEDWDRVAYISTYAANANPFLKSKIVVENPFREPSQPVKMTERETAAFFKKLSEEG